MKAEDFLNQDIETQAPPKMSAEEFLMQDDAEPAHTDNTPPRINAKEYLLGDAEGPEESLWDKGVNTVKKGVSAVKSTLDNPDLEPAKDIVRGYKDLAFNPMGIIEGGIELASDLPAFAGGLVGAGQDLAEGIIAGGNDLEDLYELASEGFQRGSGEVEKIVPKYKSKHPDAHLVGDTLMAPASLISYTGHRVADSDILEGHPNLKGAARFTGDIAGLAAQGKLLHRKAHNGRYKVSDKARAENARLTEMRERFGIDDLGIKKTRDTSRPLRELKLAEQAIKDGKVIEAKTKLPRPVVVEGKPIPREERMIVRPRKDHWQERMDQAAERLGGKVEPSVAPVVDNARREYGQKLEDRTIPKNRKQHAQELVDGRTRQGKTAADSAEVFTRLFDEIQSSKGKKGLRNRLLAEQGRKGPLDTAKEVLSNEHGFLLLDFRSKKRRHKESIQSPEWKKVHGMIGTPEKRSIQEMALPALMNSKVKGYDRFAQLKKVAPEAYRKARIFASTKDTTAMKFDELRQGLKKVRDNELMFTDYVSAHRALTRAQRGLKNPNGVTLADAQKAIQAIEKEFVESGKDLGDLVDAFNNFQEWSNKYILGEAVESGLLSKEAAKQIQAQNRFYATFDVIEHMPESMDSIPSRIGGEYFSVANQKIIKAMKGTEKKIADPMAATINKFAEAQTVYARNRVASALVDDPAANQLFQRVATSKKEYIILKNSKLNPIMEGSWNKKEFDVVNRFKDGRLERYLAPKEIADAMKQLSPYRAPRFIRAFNDIFRKLATTLYLPFTISNVNRDALMAYTTAPVYSAVKPHPFAKDLAKGLWEGGKHEFLSNSDIVRSYVQNGGGFGYVGNLRHKNRAKAELFKRGIIKASADIVKSPFQLIEKISATVELAPRLAVYERALKQGKNVGDAAFMAREATIDFNRAGTYTRVASQWVPFLNARLQSRVSLAKALKRNPKGTLAKVFTSVVLPGVATYAWNKLYHPDLYDDIPEYVKDNYFCIVTGTGEDNRGKTAPKYIIIAKGDTGQMAWNPLEFALEEQWKKDPEGMRRFVVNYLSDLLPVDIAKEGELSGSKTLGSITPPVIKGAVEDITNKNLYRGNDIVPYYMKQNKPPELQYFEGTPELYKKIGKAAGVSPLRIQNFASSVFAGYGREGLDMNAMARGLTGRMVRTQGGEIERQAWEEIEDIETGYKTVRAYALKAIEEGDRATALRLMNQWNSGLHMKLKVYNEKFRDTEFRDRGRLRRSNMFTPQKKKYVLRKQNDKLTALEKKLAAVR